MRSSGPLLTRLLPYASLLLLAVLTAAFAAIDPRIVSGPSLLNIAAQATPILIIGIGAHIVLLTAGIDLSAGVGVALGAVIIGTLVAAGAGLPMALLSALAAMLAIGLVNGLLIAYLRITPFVTTLATMVAIQGVTLGLASRGVLMVREPALRFVGMERSFGLPNAVIAAVLVAAVAAFLMRSSAFGLRTYALGSDPAAAELAGIPVRRQTLLVYVVSALFTFLAAALTVSRVPVVTANVGGTSILLDAIAAAVLGGTSIFGGRGAIFGVVVGALIVSLLTNAFRVFGVDPSTIDLFKGLVIILALLADRGLTLFEARLAGRPA